MRSRSVTDRFPWRTALKIAWRESRSSPAKFLFVVMAVAVGPPRPKRFPTADSPGQKRRASVRFTMATDGAPCVSA